MDQRIQFISDHRRGFYPVTELCARHGISRKTGYKWLDRFTPSTEPSNDRRLEQYETRRWSRPPTGDLILPRNLPMPVP